MAVPARRAWVAATWIECRRAAASMEGKEQRFGTSGPPSSPRRPPAPPPARSTRCTTLQPLGGGVALPNMMLGELSPGGVGTGLYSMLDGRRVTVFIAGLMVGRTPELLGKSIGRREITLAPGHADHPRAGPARHRLALALPVARPLCPPRPARPVRDALRVHLRGEQQRLRVRRAVGRPAVPEPRPGDLHAAGPACPDRPVLALAGGLARQGTAAGDAGTMPTHTVSFTGFW